jgi:hypothetical protein
MVSEPHGSEDDNILTDEKDSVWKDDVHTGKKDKSAFLNKQRNKEFC